MFSQFRIAVLIVAEEIGRRGIDDDEIEFAEGLNLLQQRVSIEGAGYEDDVAGPLLPRTASSPMTRIRTSSGFSPTR